MPCHAGEELGHDCPNLALPAACRGSGAEGGAATAGLTSTNIAMTERDQLTLTLRARCIGTEPVPAS